MTQSTPRLQFRPSSTTSAGVYRDGSCIGQVSRHNEHHDPDRRYYIIDLDSDPRGFKYVRNRSLLRETLDHWVRTRPAAA